MNVKESFVLRFRADPVTQLIGLYSSLLGLLFFLMQTKKLFASEVAEAEMADLPFGRFDWGYVWSDTLVAGPTLLIGGFLILMGGRRRLRLGRMLSFAGLTINVYAMVFLLIGFAAVGEPITGGILWLDAILVVICVLSAIYLAIRAVTEPV